MPELVFKGKEFVYNHHLSVPFRPLEPQAKLSVGKPDLTGNLIIHGDNLHALKALQPIYAGKVDCIYIDPPYNTGGQTWVYNDNVNSPLMQQWLKENPVNHEDMLRHDKWACMMYPRLVLLHELLNEDGLIFVSINDIEAPILRLMMDEIFGERSFVSQLVWKSRQNKDNRNTSGVSVDHEYVLAYGKKVRGDERTGEDYENPDKDPRGDWTSGNMVGMASKKDRENLHYDLIDPKTKINYGCPDRGWRYGPDTMKELIKDKRILWPASPDGRPREKVFLDDLGDQTNISSVIGQGIYTRDGTKEVTQIFGERVFDFPKPTGLLEELLLQGCPKDGIILDSFAGTGTTAHATLALNKKDGGTRRFVLVEAEDYADTITAERVKRVIEGYKFSGTTHEEFIREPITFTSLKKADKILHDIAGIENLEAHRFDSIKKVVENGILIVTGEKAVKKRADGLGGNFTYCSLGESIEMDKLLSGEKLPSFQALGAVLFHTATNQAFVASKSNEKDGFGYLGESSAYHVWLIYKPDLQFLKSRDAALTLSRAEAISKQKKGKRHLVFAAAKFVSQRILNDRELPVEHGPLPFALYRIDRT